MFRILSAALIFGLAGSALALDPGDPLPPLSMKTAAGTPFDMSTLKGQVVYLDFWASWCGPCKESFPFMEELRREFAKDSLQVLAVNLDRKSDAAKPFLPIAP
jgi:cytochrome c biogenesis protein CcmG/thiol:disulfide interchange protein DsbE